MTRPSTRALGALPTPLRLEELSRALGLLDAIMEPEWELRAFSFDPPSTPGGEAVATMRDGEGDFYYACFIDDGSAVIRGFARDAVMSPFRRADERPWHGLYDGMPESLLPYKNGADVAPEEVTFVLWHGSRGGWRTGAVGFPPDPDPDGSERLLACLDGDPETYVAYARQRWDTQPPLDAVRAVFAHAPVDAALVRRLNPEADVDAALATARALGFHVRGPMKDKKKTKKSAPPPPATPKGPATPWKKKVNMGHATFTINDVKTRIKGASAEES